MEKTLLIVDDSQTVRKGIAEAVASAGLFSRILQAEDGVAALRILLDHRIDLILCDLVMPNLDGFRFISLVRQREEFRDLPIIMLTGKRETGMKVQGLELGANDYITKPFDRRELLARVKVHLQVKLLQDELREANDLLREMLKLDPLTRLYNRGHLMEALETEFSRASRTGGIFSLIIVDMDDFKKVNDTYGHQQGDAVLVAAAGVLQENRRPYDIVARYGGEEFVAILPSCELADAVTVANRLRERMRGLRLDGPLRDVVLTFSCGVSAFPATAADSPRTLFRLADEALYRAKNGGRDRVEAAYGQPLQVVAVNGSVK